MLPPVKFYYGKDLHSAGMGIYYQMLDMSNYGQNKERKSVHLSVGSGGGRTRLRQARMPDRS